MKSVLLCLIFRQESVLLKVCDCDQVIVYNKQGSSEALQRKYWVVVERLRIHVDCFLILEEVCRTLKVMVIEKGSPWLTLYLKSSRFLYVVSPQVHLFFF